MRQVRKDLEEFEIYEDLQWNRSKSELSFRKMIKSKARELTLKNENISTSHIRAVFMYNTRMGRPLSPPHCAKQHSLICRVMKENIQHNVNYDEIFFSEVEVETANKLKSFFEGIF